MSVKDDIFTYKHLIGKRIQKRGADNVKDIIVELFPKEIEGKEFAAAKIKLAFPIDGQHNLEVTLDDLRWQYFIV